MKKTIFLLLLITTTLFGQNQTFTGVKTFTSPPIFQNLLQNDNQVKILGIDTNGKLNWRNITTFGISDAPINNNNYVRKNGIWVTLSSNLSTVATTGNYNDLLNKPSATGWSLIGNSSTNPSTNFIGTTDNYSLRFKVNNINAGWIGNNSDRNVSLGINALRIGGQWSYCTAVGTNSMYNATTSQSTAYGCDSLFNVTTGSGNNAFGYSSGASITIGGDNSLFGNFSGSTITTGNSNINLGVSHPADVTITTGSYNVLLGNRIRGLGINSSRNVIIGTYQGNGTELNDTIILATGGGYSPVGVTRVIIDSNGKTKIIGSLSVTTIPVYDGNVQALTGGLVKGDIYRTTTGVLMITY